MDNRWRVQIEGVEDLANPVTRFGDTARWIAHTVKQDDDVLNDLHIEVTNGRESQVTEKPFGVPKSGTKNFDDRKNEFTFFVEAPRPPEALTFRVLKRHKLQSDALVGEASVARPGGRQTLTLKRESKTGRTEKGFIMVEVREALQPKGAAGPAAASPTTTAQVTVPTLSKPTLPAAAMERTPLSSPTSAPRSGDYMATCMSCAGGLVDMAKQLVSSVQSALAPQDLQIAQVDFMRRKASDPQVMKLPSGLMYKVLQKGTGTSHPTLRDDVSCKYAGTFVNGKVFDSSKGSEVSFSVSRVVPGWTEALKKMVVNDKWELYIPPHLGYGERGAPPVIPPNSVLVFELELARISRR